MTFRDLFAAVRRGWVLVVLSVVVGAAVATAWTATRTPQYEATSQLFLGVTTATEADDTRQDTLYLQQRMPSYAAVLGSPALGDRVAGELDLELTGADVAERMTVEVPEGTVLLDVAVRDSSAERAQAIANAVGDEFADYLAELEDAGDAAIDAVAVTTVEPAELPGSPGSPDVRVNVLAGVLLGLAVGLGLAFVREALDDRVHGTGGMATLGLRPLGELPARGRDRAQGWTPARENGIRRIRLHLLADEQRRKDRPVVAVAAPTAGSDIAGFALDLARSLVAAGETVIVVDADLANPRLTRLLDLPADGPGFAGLLAGAAEPAAVLVTGDDGLRVVPAGHPSRHPADLLLPGEAERALRGLAALADRVVVAGPPLDGPAEAEVVATANDGLVLLVSAGTTRRAATLRAVDALRNLDADLLGCVLERRS